MKISAKINSGLNKHEVEVDTNNTSRSISIPVKQSGFGSSVNGGELLVLALATCYCNDLYRSAAKTNIPITGIEVECSADFGAEGEPGDNFRYQVKIDSEADAETIRQLVQSTDKIAEIHNTLRKGVSVTLVEKV